METPQSKFGTNEKIAVAIFVLLAVAAVFVQRADVVKNATVGNIMGAVGGGLLIVLAIAGIASRIISYRNR